jgi:hypothetical protein
MAADPLADVAPGQKFTISARGHNLTMEAVRAFQTDRITLGLAGPLNLSRNRDFILVRNDTGEDQNQFAVLSLNGLIFSPTDNLEEFRRRQCHAGIKPTVAVHWGGWFCVLAEPILADKVGRAFVDGITPVKLNVIDEDAHWFADVDDDDVVDTLRTCQDGSAQILMKETGTGEKWGVVRLGVGTRHFYAKITAHTRSGSQGSYTNTYSFEEVKKTDAAYAAWTTVDGGLAGTAYNGIEYEPDGYPYSDDRMIGVIVRMHRVQFGTTLEYWFEAWNAS